MKKKKEPAATPKNKPVFQTYAEQKSQKLLETQPTLKSSKSKKQVSTVSTPQLQHQKKTFTIP